MKLTVTDVPAAATFLETYFGMSSIGGHGGMAFLHDGHGFVLALMKPAKGAAVAYPETFHVGFFVEHEATVDDIHRRLKDDGFELADPERRHAYGFYVRAPGGFTVELGA